MGWEIKQRRIWNNTIAGVPLNAACRVSSVTALGRARWIGWSSAAHLHYEVYVYTLAELFKKSRRIDPITAYQTFR